MGLISPPVREKCSPPQIYSTAFCTEARYSDLSMQKTAEAQFCWARALVAALSNLPAPLELIWQYEDQESGWGQPQMLTAISTEVRKKSYPSLETVSDLVRIFVIMGIVLIFSSGSESIQVKVTLRSMVCGVRTKANPNGEKNELQTLYLALIHPPAPPSNHCCYKHTQLLQQGDSAACATSK